ncbi:MAG TPA: DUF5667 domain-containing protein [Methanocella sp.]|jgi:hypothetical protein
MSKKIWIVLIIASLLMAAIPVSNAESNGKSSAGVEKYNGLFGADSLFYGLKLFVQHVDLSLEGNASAKLQKQLALGRQRLSEAYTVADRNDTVALTAALTAYTEELKALNVTMDNEGIDDITYLDAGDELQGQEDSLSNMTNSTDLPSEITDLYSQTLSTTVEIKNGRPFIWCDNTSTAYFLPPGQMKKIEAAVSTGKFGTNHTPAGLGKKGYITPEPLRLENGTIVWPWDGGYNDYVAMMNSDTENGVNDKVVLFSETTKHGNGKDKSFGKGNGNGKK